MLTKSVAEMTFSTEAQSKRPSHIDEPTAVSDHFPAQSLDNIEFVPLELITRLK